MNAMPNDDSHGARELYDHIGVNYAALRQPDARIAAAIADALGDAKTVVNVGAGSGSYEPHDRRVVAVEPSVIMIRQREADSAPAVRASATHLPFRDQTFDAALAVLTVHHWPDRQQGLYELARVARDTIIVVTWDPASCGFWLVDDYFPDIVGLDRPLFPTMEELRDALGVIESWPLPIPHDCTDGFLGAYWRRPHAYLDAHVRGAISTFAKITDIEPRLERLRQDLATGIWNRRYGHLLSHDTLDLGYRLVIAHPVR